MVCNKLEMGKKAKKTNLTCLDITWPSQQHRTEPSQAGEMLRTLVGRTELRKKLSDLLKHHLIKTHKEIK